MLKKFLFSSVAFLGGIMLLITALLLWPLPDMPDVGIPGDFLIRNVDVVDVRSGTLRRDRHVIVHSGVITAVSSPDSVAGHESLIEVDGEGKYLMPGLWDMHTHSSKLAPQYYHPLLIANGVTGVREMWGCMSEPDSFVGCIHDRRRWNEALDDHNGLSPRFVQQSSFQINGGNEVPNGYPGFFKARNADEARQLVAFYAEAGTDFLKTYSELSSDAYFALAGEAHKQGLELAGHRPLSVSLQEMLRAGQSSVDHPRLFLFECYAAAAEFRALPDPLAAYDHALRQRLVDQHDAERCEELIHAMADSGTWWVPTLQVLRMSALAGDDSFRSDPRLKYIPWLIKKGMWMPDADRAAAQPTDESGRNIYKIMYQMALAHVGQAHAAGVKILAGTDAGDTYVFPGFSIHVELAALVSSGMSPWEAIRSATIDAAVFSAVEETYGSIEAGKAADMILLDSNPLADILNTQQIRGLFFNGKFYDRAALQRLLDFAERQASSVQTNLQLFWAAVNSPIVRVQLAD